MGTTIVPIPFVQCLDERTGTLVLIPEAVWAHRNERKIELSVIRAAETATPDWLTVKAAARTLMKDLNLDFAAAKSRVLRAADSKKFESAGDKGSRRIDPVSFSAWRLEQRDRDLDAEDEEESE